MAKKKKKKSKKEKKKEWTVVRETDVGVHGNKKNNNKYCIGCTKIDTCYTGKAAMIAYCIEYEEEEV